MHYMAGRIAESFKTDLFVIWSEDNLGCRVLGSPDKVDSDDLSMEEGIFVRSLENTMLNSVSLHGVKGVKRVRVLTESLYPRTKALSVARRSGFWKLMALTSRPLS